MKTVIALAVVAAFATSSVNAQTIAVPTEPVADVLSGSGLGATEAAIGIAAAILIIGAGVAIGSNNDDDDNATNGSNQPQ